MLMKILMVVDIALFLIGSSFLLVSFAGGNEKYALMGMFCLVAFMLGFALL